MEKQKKRKKFKLFTIAPPFARAVCYLCAEANANANADCDCDYDCAYQTMMDERASGIR